MKQLIKNFKSQLLKNQEIISNELSYFQQNMASSFSKHTLCIYWCLAFHLLKELPKELNHIGQDLSYDYNTNFQY